MVSVVWAGCSPDRASFGNGPTDLGNADGGNAEPDAACGLVCSRDLRSVRDCNDVLVQECPADTACGNGKCIAPCDAAALNEGSVGCSFAIPSPVDDQARGSCFAIFVANNWTSPASLRLSYKGEVRTIDRAAWVPYVEDGVVKHKPLEGPIPPGSGAVVFLTNEPELSQYAITCPAGVQPILDTDITRDGSGIVEGFFASSDVPVSMYSVFPYGGASSYSPSATLLLPTTSLRTNYVVMSSWGGAGDAFGKGIVGDPVGGQPGRPTVQIMAIEDDTTVELLPKVDVVGGNGVARAPANHVASFRLERGQILQLVQQNELVGSVVESSRPVGVFGGHTCMFVPYGVGACDSDNKQIPPLSAWGHEYAVLPAPDRVRLAGTRSQGSGEPSIVRFVGAAADTKLVYEPRRPEGAPTTLEAGELARFFTSEPFVVSSQGADHPFFVSTVMTGAIASSSGIGDPETAIAIPTDQWLDSYGFFSDPTYARSAVFVTRRRTNGTFHDVKLDCAGVVTSWEPIAADYEWTYVELTRAAVPQTYPAGTCADGVHGIQSDGPFTMTVWGLGDDASYSYPGGTGLRRATQLYVPVR